MSCQNKVIAQLTEPLLLPLRNDHNLQPALPMGVSQWTYSYSGCVSVSHLRANNLMFTFSGKHGIPCLRRMNISDKELCFYCNCVPPFFLPRCLTGFLTWQFGAMSWGLQFFSQILVPDLRGPWPKLSLWRLFKGNTAHLALKTDRLPPSKRNSCVIFRKNILVLTIHFKAG